MRKILFTLLLLVVAIGANAKKTIEYSLESAGSGVQGTYLVKVWITSSSKKVSDDEILYGAIHGVIFRGFGGSQGMPAQRPMAPSITVEQQKADYFDKFFGKEGAYKAFATIVAGSYQRTKTPKGYKVGATVQVQKDNLRKELEQSGIIKGLASGF